MRNLRYVLVKGFAHLGLMTIVRAFFIGTSCPTSVTQSNDIASNVRSGSQVVARPSASSLSHVWRDIFHRTARYQRANWRREKTKVVMMARASQLRLDQKRRTKQDQNRNAPASKKAQKAAIRERKAFFRDKYALSGSRLIKLQQEDVQSFYIGVVGKNLAGRAQALKAIDSYLKRAMELKVGKYDVPGAVIKLVDSSGVQLSRLAGKDEGRLALLRRCDLLVHVVRCFDTQRAPNATSLGVTATEGAVHADSMHDVQELDHFVPATPRDDVQALRADMALADLRMLQERSRANHTRWFWRDKKRAYSEKEALPAVETSLEEKYIMGGDLKPTGIDFANDCLADDQSTSKSHQRRAIKEIGFITPKPVIYVANTPPEAAVLNHEGSEEKPRSSSKADAIERARDYAEQVLALGREFNIPTLSACLRTEDGQNALGSKVHRAIPKYVLARDPKVKKALKSAKNYGRTTVANNRSTRQGREIRSPSTRAKSHHYTKSTPHDVAMSE